MPFIKPEIIGRSARALFKRGHSESIWFFFLKGEGASAERAVPVKTTGTPETLKYLAAQPPGFDQLVQEHVDEFVGNNKKGFPSRPGGNRTPTVSDYSMYFPITDEAQYILRKADLNRSTVYTNITSGQGRGSNPDRAMRSDIIEVAESDGGKYVRFRQGYEYAALWYFGPERDHQLSVPLEPLAIWLHRSTDFGEVPRIEALVRDVVVRLNLTEKELYLLFRNDSSFSLEEHDFTDAFDLKKYFYSICIPNDVTAAPDISVVDRHASLTKEKWELTTDALGFSDVPREQPCDVAKRLVSAGERNVLLLGPPRTGKSKLALAVAADYLGVDEAALFDDTRFSRAQFHHGWTYSAFIRKLAPQATAGGALVFDVEDGVFTRHCRDNESGRSVFIVDEINRANVSEVFGEAFQLFEIGYRGMPIDLAVRKANTPRAENQLAIPPDMLLIFTANDLDRSTTPLDLAFFERVASVRCDADYAMAAQILRGQFGWDDELSLDFSILLSEIARETGFPIGHANFYSFGSPERVGEWYRTKLRPALSVFLGSYRTADLQTVDRMIQAWLDQHGLA